MNSRSYFVKDEKGILHRLYYCSYCTKGPYTENKENVDFKLLGYDRPLCACMSCIKTLGIRSNPDPKFNKQKIVKEVPSLIGLPILDKAIRSEVKTVSDPTSVVSFEKIESNGRRIQLAKAILAEISGRKPLPLKNNFYTILAQCPDKSYIVLVSTNPKKEIERVNRGEVPRYKKLPVEMVYARAHNNRSDAEIVRDIISKYKIHQKEKLALLYQTRISISAMIIIAVITAALTLVNNTKVLWL